MIFSHKHLNKLFIFHYWINNFFFTKPTPPPTGIKWSATNVCVYISLKTAKESKCWSRKYDCGIILEMGYMDTNETCLSKQSEKLNTKYYKLDIFSNIIMRHFLGSVGVRRSVRGPFFTRHQKIDKCTVDDCIN